MPYNHFTEKLLGLQDVEIKNIESFSDKNVITIRMCRKPHVCPHCGKVTNRIHDYRKQSIKDIPAFDKQTIIILEKRRYACDCGKRFIEDVPFLPKYYRMTLRLILKIMESLKGTSSLIPPTVSGPYLFSYSLINLFVILEYLLNNSKAFRLFG